EDLLRVSFPIMKWEQDADGDLIVKGIATDGTVDRDDQIVDPTWSAKALNDWIATGGNVRQSHDARHPIGKGLRVDISKEGTDKHWVTSLIVDPLAQKMVKKGVLTVLHRDRPPRHQARPHRESPWRNHRRGRAC